MGVLLGGAALLLLPFGAASQEATTAPGGGQPDARQAELQQRALLGELTPLQRLASPGAFPAGRDAAYSVAPLFAGGPAGRLIGGLAVGGYASSSVAYDSNPEGKSGGGNGNAVLATSLGLVASPILTRHALAVTGSITATGTLPDVAQSDVSGNLGAAGTLNLSPRSAVELDLTYARQIEAPETSGGQAGTSAGSGNQISAKAVYLRRYRRASLSLGVTVDGILYESDSTDDYVAPGLTAAFTYALTPRLALQAASSLSQTIYPESGAGGTDRGARTMQATVGATYQPGRRTSASLSVGYERSDPVSGGNDGTSGLIFSAGLSGRLGESTTASFSASRSFDPTTNVKNAAGVTVTEAMVQVQRAIGLRLTASLELAASLDEYVSINRTDVLLSPAAGLTYALTDTVSLTLHYAYSHDFSDVSTAGFERHVVTAGLAIRF